MNKLDARVTDSEPTTIGRLRVGEKMSKLDSALFLAGVRVDALQHALDFLRDCNGDVVRIRTEIDYRRENLGTSTRPEYQLGESPRLFLDTYIAELERIVADLEPEIVLAV